MSFQNKKKMAAIFGIAIFFIVADRFFKSLALKMGEGADVKIFSDWLIFSFVKNYNIALSLPLSGVFVTFLIAVLSLLVVYFCLLFIKKEDVVGVFSMTLIALGAISNLVDRIIYGFVVDYLDVKYFSVLNLADVMITVGVVIFIISSLYRDKKQIA